jgi:hypothetical protein
VNKKKQKNFIYCGLWRAPANARGQRKFFASPGGEPFFQKRSAFFSAQAAKTTHFLPFSTTRSSK